MFKSIVRLFKKETTVPNLKVNVFTEGLNINTYARKSLEAFSKGILKCGDHCEVIRGLKYKECDVAVIFGDVRDSKVKKKRMRLKAEVIGRHRGKGLIVIDTPVLMRPFDKDEQFRRVGIDSLFADSGNFNNKMMTSKRFDELSEKFSIKKNNFTNRGDNIYILLQRFFDASLKGSQKIRPQKYFQWLSLVLSELESETKKHVVIRPHPGSLIEKVELDMIEKFKNTIKHPRVSFDYQKKSLFEVLDDAFVTITYNSGSAIDSLLYGIPNITYDSGSHAYPIVQHNCKNIDNIEMPNIEQWLYDMSYVDWSLDEISNGKPWIHLKKEVLKYV